MSTQYEIASKDCRVCNRRRIKCDRRTPTCGKCEKRGLTCSGYGVILKWDQGVASRGNLKGKALPVNRRDNLVSTLNLPSSPKLHEVPIGRTGDLACRVIESSNLEISIVPKPLISDQLHSPEHRRLLHHYDHVVAPNMAWADCPENPWRHTIIPLALQSPPLLNAVLAFAAKHINALTFANHRGSVSIVPAQLPEKFQQQAMQLLAQEIRRFATTDISQSTSNIGEEVARTHKNALLATMLVLCNVETVWPDSHVWQVHLNAARIVMATHGSSDPTEKYDSTSMFLEQELFIANTFASTTNFLNSPSSSGFKLDDRVSRPSSIFIEFLKLIEMVTNLERQAITQPALLVDSGVSPSGLRTLFENARSRTLQLGKTFQASSSNDYLHLSHTVNCFYHAGLIYSHRALLQDDTHDLIHSHETQLQLATSKAELFSALGFAETSKPTFAQDLVWPLFIAGTEATQKDEQEMVVAKLQQAMSETGFSNCQHALEFLKALWDRWDLGGMSKGDSNWIDFAREWTGQGRTFLVF